MLWPWLLRDIISGISYSSGRPMFAKQAFELLLPCIMNSFPFSFDMPLSALSVLFPLHNVSVFLALHDVSVLLTSPSPPPPCVV